MKLRDTVADLADSLELPEEAVSDAMRVTLIGQGGAPWWSITADCSDTTRRASR